MNEKTKSGNNKLKNFLIYGSAAGIILLALGGLAYFMLTQGRIYVESSEITAPKIDLSAKSSGILQDVYVKEGDHVNGDNPIARIGDQIVTANTDGLIVDTNNDIGKMFNPGEAVASMIDPHELRVVAHIEEDKGFNEIKVGQSVIFTADAFGSKEYYGIVDDVSDTSRDSAVVFSISDKREKRQFDIKIRYNTDDYPELKNGMSAKVWIYTD